MGVRGGDGCEGGLVRIIGIICNDFEKGCSGP